MVTRIVKMTFEADKVEEFLLLFDRYKTQIRNASGCLDVELLRDVNQRAVFFTYSHWDQIQSLDLYRTSATFSELWPQVKSLFALPAEAWTLETEMV